MEKRNALEWASIERTCDCASLIVSVISELRLKGLLPKSYAYDLGELSNAVEDANNEYERLKDEMPAMRHPDCV
jgi:hypothetical protein